MSYQERENIVNILSGLVITLVFSWIVYQKHLEGVYDLTQDMNQWGRIFLLFVVVQIVSRIVIFIVFHIINAIATRETKVPILDERAKMIRLLGTRNSHYVFTGGFVLGIIGLALGFPVYTLFIVFVVSGLLSEIVDNGTQLYFHRRGV